jgi:hypothetical protein
MFLFGDTNAYITPMTAIFGVAFVLGALIFRKSIANDLLGMNFSLIGSCVCSILAFIVMDNLFHIMKFSFGVGLICWLLGGFLLANIIGDGDTSQ